ncbi:MAG: hypothetical protein AAFV45_01025 [Pseudomonadota bacterium]
MAEVTDTMMQRFSMQRFSGSGGRVAITAATAGCVLAAGLVFVALSAVPLEAGWLTRLTKEAGEAGGDAGKFGLSGLDNGIRVLKSLPDGPDAVRLAVDATPEGHWRFANKDGDVFTAANADEMSRVVPNLAPDAAAQGKAGQLALYLDQDTVFKHRDLLGNLPDGARLYITADKKPYRLMSRGTATEPRYTMRMRQNVEVPIGSQPQLFSEAVWQLSRPLNKADIRIVALDVGGADALRAVPAMNASRTAARVDRIKPDQLQASFADIRGQTVLLKGRIEGDAFVVTPTGGSERRLDLSELTASASRNDVNLVFLQSNASRQPGGRNWFWQTVEVEGLEAALKRVTYADFLNALAGNRGPFSVQARAQGEGRVIVQAVPVSQSAVPLGDVVGELGEWFGTVASEVTGNVATNAVTANLNSKARQRELDFRLVPGIPSIYQFTYIAGLVMGLVGWSTSRSWWRYVWKKETRAEYATTTGYYAARVVKALAYLFVFLPIVGLPAFVVHLLLQVWGWMMIPVRIVTWIFGKATARA